MCSSRWKSIIGSLSVEKERKKERERGRERAVQSSRANKLLRTNGNEIRGGKLERGKRVKRETREKRRYRTWRETERGKENLLVRLSVHPSVGARISHLHRNKLSGTMGSFVHSEHCKHAATVFPRTNGKALQYALLTLSTRRPAIIERPRLSFVYRTIISYLVTLHGGCRHRLASLKRHTHRPLYTRRAFHTDLFPSSFFLSAVLSLSLSLCVSPFSLFSPPFFFFLFFFFLSFFPCSICLVARTTP